MSQEEPTNDLKDMHIPKICRSGAQVIIDERIRQVVKEGWTTEHDDTHRGGELCNAAACYALDPTTRNAELCDFEYLSILQWTWPWSKEAWKPTPDDRIRELAKAGALIIAEIERLQRIENNGN